MQTIGGIGNPWRFTNHGGSGARLEIINRTGHGEDLLNRALAKIPAKDTSGDADFRFGKPSRFTLTEPPQRTNPGATVIWPPDDPDEDPNDGIVIHDYDYIDRSVEVIRVEQEGEPENWVEVERILKIM